MTDQPNRLAAGHAHKLQGALIDRGRPLRFRIDGHSVGGFAGDTLLTAAIASGVTAAGRHNGAPLALDERCAPAVFLKGQGQTRTVPLPMALTPAIDGLDFATVDPRRQAPLERYGNALLGALGGRYASLSLDFDSGVAPSEPVEPPGEEQRTADFVVIGGGVAGLSAALAAGRRGASVVLVERRSWLGGDARFFGSTGDEPQPEETIGRLTTALLSLPGVTILLHTEAVAVTSSLVRLHGVTVEDGRPRARALAVSAPRIILATGCIERLPIFAGNRLPGIVGSATAFHRAERFGVWIGRRALLATSASAAYRSVIHAGDAGIDIVRAADTRLSPQSRFIEFTKARGIALSRDLRPRLATQARDGSLNVRLEHGLDAAHRAPEDFAVEQLIVGGGWQPELTLWVQAGGGARWNPLLRRLDAEGALDGVVLAGAVVGFARTSACMASGQAAAARPSRKPAAAIHDPEIDARYETPDDDPAVGAIEAAGVAYFDGGSSLVRRAITVEPGRRGRWPWQKAEPKPDAEALRPLGIADIAAAVLLGEVPHELAGRLVRERCVLPGDILADPGLAVATPAAAPALEPPAYLASRYGARPDIWVVEPADGRALEPGCLVYQGIDPGEPAAALGVIFAAPPKGRSGGLAIIAKGAGTDGGSFAVRDVSGPIAVKLVDPAAPPPTPPTTQPAAEPRRDSELASDATDRAPGPDAAVTSP